MSRRLVSKYTFSDSSYIDSGVEISAVDLYKEVESQGCVAYKFYLKYYDMTTCRFRDCDRVIDMAHHVMRCMNVDIDIPIIISPYGCVLDGYHRIVRALADGLPYVMAYRLKSFPAGHEKEQE